MNKYRVLMLGPSLSVKGGITTIEQFYLDAWDNKKYDLQHIGTFVDGNKVIKLGVFLKAFCQYFYLLLFNPPDILHIHFSWKASFYRKSIFVLLAKIFNIKIILHCNASRFDVFYENSNQFKQKFIQGILNSATLLIVVSEQWRKYFANLSLNVPIKVLYNPVSFPENIPLIAQPKPIVLSLGRLGERKGTYDILKAIPLILATFPKTKFCLGGDGDIQQVKNILSKESWGQNVELLGWVQGKEKAKNLQQASIFLLPSYNEGLPLAILEAMSYGIPVISTPVGGIPEAVIDGKTGFLIQPGDITAIAEKVTLLLKNFELRNQIGTNAREYAQEKFEIKVILQKLFAIYDSLLETKISLQELKSQ